MAILSTGPRWVNMYRVTQAYGGSEEGGWYYPVGQPLESRYCTTAEEVDEARTALGERAAEWNKHERRTHYRVLAEDHYAEAYPKHRPMYE